MATHVEPSVTKKSTRNKWVPYFLNFFKSISIRLLMWLVTCFQPLTRALFVLHIDALHECIIQLAASLHPCGSGQVTNSSAIINSFFCTVALLHMFGLM